MPRNSMVLKPGPPPAAPPENERLGTERVRSTKLVMCCSSRASPPMTVTLSGTLATSSWRLVAFTTMVSICSVFADFCVGISGVVPCCCACAVSARLEQNTNAPVQCTARWLACILCAPFFRVQRSRSAESNTITVTFDFIPVHRSAERTTERRNAAGWLPSNLHAPFPRIARPGVQPLEKGVHTMKSIITCVAVSAASLGLSTAAMAVSEASSPRASAGPSQTMSSKAPTTKTQVAQSGSTTTKGPSHTGQPNQSCGSACAPNTPGNAAAAPGSAFNPDGTAGTRYAGQQPQNSRNTASVSQYDVACAKQ